MKKSIIALSLFAVLFTACKKDKDEEEQAVAVTTASVSGTYTLGAVTAKFGANPEQNFTNSWYDEACQRDDNFTLNANGSAVFTDAGVKCNPAGDEAGTWSLSNNNTKINLDGEEFTIQSFNGKVLKVGNTDNSTGTAVSYSLTFNKQ